jgi:hypothetical protein
MNTSENYITPISIIQVNSYEKSRVIQKVTSQFAIRKYKNMANKEKEKFFYE